MNLLKKNLKLSLLIVCTVFAFGCAQHSAATKGSSSCSTCAKGASGEKMTTCHEEGCDEHHCAKCGSHHGESYHNSDDMKNSGNSCHKSM